MFIENFLKSSGNIRQIQFQAFKYETDIKKNFHFHDHFGKFSLQMKIALSRISDIQNGIKIQFQILVV